MVISGEGDRPAEADEHVFEFSGGKLCLDFANTVSNHTPDRPGERLTSYARLVSWGRQAGVLTEEQAQRLLKESARRPAEAASTVEWAITLREAIYRIFSAVAAGRPPEASDLAVFNAALKAMAMSQIIQANDGFVWTWKEDEEALDRMVWPVVRSAAELLTSQELPLVRECASDTCGWLFIDNSRNHSRRWCDMKSCGNRAKVRRYYQRRKPVQCPSPKGGPPLVEEASC